MAKRLKDQVALNQRLSSQRREIAVFELINKVEVCRISDIAWYITILKINIIYRTPVGFNNV